ncbi:hypothetical protein [Brevibacillus sp. 179-C 1.1 NHS]|uniref:hypothetical protein n=1 Tax=Brevibacillus sp. 179-C 1.1 NHS TaxID=3235177 RepID=UPI0039A21EEC
MFENIHWSIYSKASSKEKAMKVFSNLEMSFGTNLSLLACEPYTEGEYKYSISFTSPLSQTDLAQAVLETLLTSRKLGRNWTVNGPRFGAQEIWHFDGICTEPTLTGVDWVMFTVRND